VRAPTPHEQAAIFGAVYVLTLLVLRVRGLRRAAHGPKPSYYAAPDGKVFMGSPEWIAEARARYGADNPTAN
jgi:hypothetical protein